MKKLIKYKNGGSTQFKCGGMKRVPRKKAFWGALASVIGGIMNVAGNAITSKAQREAENERFDKELKFKENLIEKNRIYSLMQNELVQQMNSNSNQSMYDNFRNAKFGTKIKVKKKGEYGLSSNIALFNPYKLGTEQINLNLKDINSNNTIYTENDSDFNGSDIFGKAFDVIVKGVRGRELTEKSMHNAILNNLNYRYAKDNFVNQNNLKYIFNKQ